MALIGYQRKAERKNGGIRTLGLIAASDVTSVNYSAEDRALFELTLAAEKKIHQIRISRRRSRIQ